MGIVLALGFMKRGKEWRVATQGKIGSGGRFSNLPSVDSSQWLNHKNLGGASMALIAKDLPEAENTVTKNKVKTAHGKVPLAKNQLDNDCGIYL
jgi:hypothetical protein